MRQNAENQQMERWGDKTPEYTRHLPVLRELFPSAQFIHIVRDGRDVALSGYQMHFGAKNAYAAAREWGDVLAHVQAFAATMPEASFLELRYEDLLTDTQAQFARIVRFLDIHDPDGRVGEAAGLLASADLRAGNFNKWKTELSPSEQQMFAAVAEKWLRRYRYEVPAVTRPSPGPLATLYWQVDNTLRRMMMREYWADTFYKVRLRARAQGLPVRARRSRDGVHDRT
jgi:hypothetical protein